MHHRRGVNPVAIAWHAALVLGALWLFVIALQLIKNGASGLKPVLDAFAVDPPRIWAGGPYSGRAGGDAQFERFLELSPLEALAWRTRVEGSQGIPERERLGPVIGWQFVPMLNFQP